eukprot:CAMPEP_0197422114 /NCGR_PEP_ID=MMETSP1170-20131217/13886_1 /TAXON_ID=54406 /ORGANISM="Sarcinochrysis sp, Strain CCMP770" /LENGTH=55 /DNA_ID=CAMNT_0042949425 /DNA_START=10 /DNA_END=175 /DNA_ORIENTATION=-
MTSVAVVINLIDEISVVTIPTTAADTCRCRERRLTAAPLNGESYVGPPFATSKSF